MDERGNTVALTITRIPDRYRAGLAKINALPIEKVEAIAAALGKASVTSRKELIAAVEQASEQGSEDAEAVVTSLQSLYIFKASAESPVTQFVPVVIGAMQSSGIKELVVSDDAKPVLATKLTLLLSLSSLERFSKIQQIKADHQSIFYDAKILTDLRPLFDDPKEQPLGAIVTHTLKIICHEAGEHKELYFSLDAEDIRTLQKIAERAADKMSSLQVLLKSANIPDLS
jgi:hypothetical protein